MKLYISTPINARREVTFQAKREAAAKRCKMLKMFLEEEMEGYEIVTPFDTIPLTETVNEEVAIGRCVTAVLRCDAIYLDHGWTGSKGCNIEYHAAKTYGKVIFEHDKM